MCLDQAAPGRHLRPAANWCSGYNRGTPFDRETEMKRSRTFASFVVLIAVSLSPCLAQEAPSRTPAGTAEMSKAQRISLCKSRAEKPLEPSDVEPVRLGPETRLVPLHTPWPQFGGAQKGSAVLGGIIDEDGCLREARVVKGGQQKMDRAALRAVRQWVFQPFLVEGKPVRVQYFVTINYEGVR
jgi:TonB family protein